MSNKSPSSRFWVVTGLVVVALGFPSVLPITVKHALSKVEGVSKTDVSFDKREAQVTFDDAKTSAQALMKATANAGYPASVKE